MDSIPASSRMPLAICASAVDRNVEMVIRSEELTAAPPVLVNRRHELKSVCN